MAGRENLTEAASRSPSTESARSSIASDLSFESIGRDVLLPSAASANSPSIEAKEALQFEELAFHPRYAAHDQMVVFQVEKTLFRVHSYLFTKGSAYFRDIITQHSIKTIDDSSSVAPILRLEDDIRSVDFERFLSILYPDEIGRYAATSLDEWTSILNLSSKWDFTSIRSLAIRELLPLASPVDKVVLGRTYGFDDWLPDAFAALCERPEPLSDEEAERMTKSDIAKLARAREGARKSRGPSAAGAKASVTQVFGFGQDSATNTSARPDKPNVLVQKTTKAVQEPTARRIQHPDPAEPSNSSEISSIETIDDSVLGATIHLWKILDRAHNYDPATYRSRYDSSWSHYDNLLQELSRLASDATKLRQIITIMMPDAMIYPDYFSEIFAKVYKQLSLDTQLEPTPDNGGATTPRELLGLVLEEQCQQLAGAWHSGQEASAATGFSPKRKELARFVATLVQRGVLSADLLCLCCTSFFNSAVDPTSPPSALTEVCGALVSIGKLLDQKCVSDVMDDLFRRLGAVILSQQPKAVHDRVLDVIRRRREGWPNN